MSNSLVHIPCPHCGEPVALSVHEFKTAATMRCPHCSTSVDFATHAQPAPSPDQAPANQAGGGRPAGRTKVPR
jgi:endogenous inhibitor of DNA gyrase (YacG/DUF329 family)